ncbi:hypothetical protein BH10BAC2_BH10BAC2_33230 [soil metagenome]
MKRLILFCLFFSVQTTFSQKNTADSAERQDLSGPFIRCGNCYGIIDTTIVISDYLLVEVNKDSVSVFKKKFRKGIKRQLTSQRFIVDATSGYWINMAFAKKSGIILKYDPTDLSWKLSPFLFQNQEKFNDKAYVFTVETTDTTALEYLIDLTGSLRMEIMAKPGNHLYYIKTTMYFLNKILLPARFINSVDLRLTQPKEETVINDYDNSTNNVNLFFAKYPGVNGEGLTVSIKENQFDKVDIDFKNRYKETGLGSASNTSHATTMATLVAGGGNSFFTGRGVAGAATLASSDFGNLLPDGNSYNQYDISIQNHSYGVGVENFYGSDAAAYDASMIDNPLLLHVFSAGNAGTVTDTLAGSPYRNIAGFANITGSFKMAKNILTVGSVDSFFTVPLLSSKGPAYDGRVKPELVAYGNDGSSGAAAITSGTVLAVQSAYAQTHSGVLPNNALTKSILINSADDINKNGPDFYSGYGNVNTYRAVQDILSGNFLSGAVADGETKDFTITVPANAKNLKISLVWTDPAAQTNAFTALVNDLDLQLERQGNSWLPWVSNSSAHIDSLNQAAKRKRDSLNVVEQITIDNPGSGTYIINVKGYNVPDGPQEFYIAYRWDTANTFYFISPAAKDHFTSGANSIFRWKSNYSNTTNSKLEYSIDKGTSWKLVNAAVDLDNKYLKWIAPDTFSIAIARMTIGSDVYISDTFNFSKQLNPQVGYKCNDSVLIFWNKAPGVIQYKVYTLGNKYLQPLANTTDTSIVISANNDPYIAVTTVLQDGYTGVNSYTFNYNNLNIGCYINNFLADLTVNKTAQLQLSLGTIFNVTSIQFQELTTNGWQIIQTISPVTIDENSYEANTLRAGMNTFRAVVTLKNGSVIYSDEATIYFTGNSNYVLMPNPISQGQNLTILSDNFFTNTVIIYDIAGRKILQQAINGTRSQINTSRLAKGVYILVIWSEGAKAFTGKIVIQ